MCCCMSFWFLATTPTEEKYLIVEGEATMIFERSRQSLKKGDSVYLPPPVTARE